MSELSPYRVLVVDDSRATREMLCRAIARDPRLEVVAQACDGEEAVIATHRYAPDVISMDLVMPRSGGLQAITRIMAEKPTPIVVVSALSQSTEGVKALQAGALAVAPKPEALATPKGQAALREVLSSLRLMAEIRVLTRPLPKGPTGDTVPARRGTANESGFPSRLVPEARDGDGARPALAGRAMGENQGALPPASALSCICIAASTGGPPALRRILEPLPASFPLPIIVVQHISEGFGESLVQWLNDVLTVRVSTARYGQSMEPGLVTLAPDNLHLEIGSQGRFLLSEGQPIRSHRPSADPLFSSAARAFGSGVLGIVLTGMGQDGLDGALQLKSAGGTLIAQDEQSSVVFGMPKAVVEAGLCDRVMSLEMIAELLLSLSGAG